MDVRATMITVATYLQHYLEQPYVVQGSDEVYLGPGLQHSWLPEVAQHLARLPSHPHPIAINSHFHPEYLIEKTRRRSTLEEALGKDEQPVDMAVPCFAFPEHWLDRHPLDLPPKARAVMISLHPT